MRPFNTNSRTNKIEHERIIKWRRRRTFRLLNVKANALVMRIMYFGKSNVFFTLSGMLLRIHHLFRLICTFIWWHWLPLPDGRTTTRCTQNWCRRVLARGALACAMCMYMFVYGWSSTNKQRCARSTFCTIHPTTTNIKRENYKLSLLQDNGCVCVCASSYWFIRSPVPQHTRATVCIIFPFSTRVARRESYYYRWSLGRSVGQEIRQSVWVYRVLFSIVIFHWIFCFYWWRDTWLRAYWLGSEKRDGHRPYIIISLLANGKRKKNWFEHVSLCVSVSYIEQ